MESLIKNNSLIPARIPESFIEEFDKWREEKEKKNNIKISRNMGFNLLSSVLKDIDLNVELKRRKNKYIINLR